MTSGPIGMQGISILGKTFAICRQPIHPSLEKVRYAQERAVGCLLEGEPREGSYKDEFFKLQLSARGSGKLVSRG
jgi:hypothetical protein